MSYPEGMVGRFLIAYCTGGRTFDGTVTAVAERDDTGLWVQLDDEWWIAMHHVCAATWGPRP